MYHLHTHTSDTYQNVGNYAKTSEPPGGHFKKLNSIANKEKEEEGGFEAAFQHCSMISQE